MNFNPLIATDAYKITHWLQRPENLTYLGSYGEPREDGEHDSVCFEGLQGYSKKLFFTLFH